MSALKDKVDALRASLEHALSVERDLAEALAVQEQALLAGGADAIVGASTRLESILARMQESSETCRALVEDLDQGPRRATSLRELLFQLPPEHRPAVAEARTRLQGVRRRWQAQGAKNAALARAGRDAVRSVRAVLDRESECREPASAGGLDATA